MCQLTSPKKHNHYQLKIDWGKTYLTTPSLMLQCIIKTSFSDKYDSNPHALHFLHDLYIYIYTYIDTDIYTYAKRRACWCFMGVANGILVTWKWNMEKRGHNAVKSTAHETTVCDGVQKSTSQDLYKINGTSHQKLLL